jgi:integrase
MGRITVGKSMAQFGCKFSVKASIWDTRANRASGKSKAAVEINRKLDAIAVSVNTHYLRLREINPRVTAIEVKCAFQGIATMQPTLLRYFALHNAEFEKKVGINRTLSTHKKYRHSLTVLTEFVVHRYKLTDIPFSRLDLAFIEQFDFYLRVDRRLQSSSILAVMIHLRKIVRCAVGDGIISHDPFDGYKAQRPLSKQRYISREELDLIVNVELIDYPNLIISRDMFVFAAFTGLSYIDAKNLSSDKIVTESDGTVWIKTHRKKTGTPVNVPLLDIPLGIIEKYRGFDKSRLLPVYANSKVNKDLRAIAKLCGIDKRITFHQARHTYATEVCLSHGVPIESVSSMLGHRDMRSTQIYAKITERKIAEDVCRAEQRINRLFYSTAI